jgi:hypothetical protein
MNIDNLIFTKKCPFCNFEITEYKSASTRDYQCEGCKAYRYNYYGRESFLEIFNNHIFVCIDLKPRLRAVGYSMLNNQPDFENKVELPTSIITASEDINHLLKKSYFYFNTKAMH